ncbi:glycosyltransferase [Micromonospora citrea]|uniref:glycosyltransferase n=1 Tax=Micromonospora citrea TaxID=47855 RepID=UPI003C35B796
MRVALLGPVAWRTPPDHYGPWEQVTGLLAEGLVTRGVDVTLFATLDSVTSAALDGVCPRGYADDPDLDGRVWEAMHVSHAMARSSEFDLVHSHLDWLPLAFAEHCRAPLLTTVHGFSGPGILPAYVRARSSYVSISDADRSAELDYVATVHHGVDLTGLPFTRDAGPGLAAFGRIHPDKGTHTAIEIARRAGRPLTICGEEDCDNEITATVLDALFRRRATAWRTPGSSGSPTNPDPCTGPLTPPTTAGTLPPARWAAVTCAVSRAPRCAGRASATRASRCSPVPPAAGTSPCAAPTARPSA